MIPADNSERRVEFGLGGEADDEVAHEREHDRAVPPLEIGRQFFCDNRRQWEREQGLGACLVRFGDAELALDERQQALVPRRFPCIRVVHPRCELRQLLHKRCSLGRLNAGGMATASDLEQSAPRSARRSTLKKRGGAAAATAAGRLFFRKLRTVQKTKNVT